MLHSVGLTLAAALLLSANLAAQTVRFETTAGNFDLVLNPTGNPLLQEHVDNLLQYVMSGRYDGTVINRADEAFVLQMGIFDVASANVPTTIDGFVPIEKFGPINGVPAFEVGLSNTAGTVGLALSGGPGGTNQDSGTSSFFVNIGNNAFLDFDFAVFAQVVDMATVNAIMAMNSVDLTSNPAFGADPGNLYFTDVPLLPNGNLVLISRAFVVPEPAVGVLAGCALMGCCAGRVRRRKQQIS